MRGLVSESLKTQSTSELDVGWHKLMAGVCLAVCTIQFYTRLSPLGSWVPTPVAAVHVRVCAAVAASSVSWRTWRWTVSRLARQSTPQLRSVNSPLRDLRDVIAVANGGYSVAAVYAMGSRSSLVFRPFQHSLMSLGAFLSARPPCRYE